ncbi:transcription initiation factor TFIID subunit 4-like isoform X2 [Halichoeres trimaculatus]|uniref:transcription initiation factor TFIID subunit 4-like isoform X2 n=1 Tax=Halichoeres trimaculatus TaxID=147232 RepID=UPI003D9F6FD9
MCAFTSVVVMATNEHAVTAQMQDPSVAPSGDKDKPVQVKIVQIPANCGPITCLHPLPTVSCVPKTVTASAPPKVIGPAGQAHPHVPSVVQVPELQTSATSVMVIAKVAPGRAANATSQPQAIKPAVSQGPLMNQGTNQGRTVVLTVPRAAAPQPVAVSPRLPQTTSPQLPANIQIPPGMMLVRSDSGQLMLVSQQALAQAQQTPRGIITHVSRPLAPQEAAAAGPKRSDKVTVIRMAGPPSFQQAPPQKTAVVIGVAPKPAVVQPVSAVSEHRGRPLFQGVVTEPKKEPPVTYTQETLESVKKCKNFLVTLIKLASSDSRSANMANNVRALVKKLLEGKLEAEEFTEQLYKELKTTPQPCLVPFLKKSLPAVRRLTADPQVFIQQASTSSHHPNPPSSSSNCQKVIQKLPGATLRPGFDTLTQSRTYILGNSRTALKPTVAHSEKQYKETFVLKQPFTQDLLHHKKFTSRESLGSYREDDDINDVASMAGVNLREENAKILTTIVGSVEKSCQDQPFLSPSPVLSRILRTGQALGITEVGPDVAALVSHATQECLRGLLERLTLIAEHRKTSLKEDTWHAQVSDVRSQVRFIEEVERLKKRKKDEEERDRLLRLARNRSQSEDPQQQQLKQRAKELQKMEEAQLQQKEANLTALAAIGPRRRRPLEQTEGQMTLLHRQSVHRATRVMLRDLLVCMEQDHFLRRSLTLYKAML